MIQGCDWTHIVENEGIGGAVIAIIWSLWAWYKRRHPKLS
jgi:hypothetical protein